MQDYKVIQYQNLKLKTFDDSLANLDYIIEDLEAEDLVSKVYAYFCVESSQLSFPAKSYAVAIIYAVLIQEYFGTEIKESLNDDDLFWGTDKYFVPYSNGQEIYDRVLSMLETNNLLDFEKSELKQVQKTVEYFRHEFNI